MDDVLAYSILGVTSSASAEEIKAAFRNKCREHHPDKRGCSDKFMELKVAYDKVGDGDSRVIYDRQVRDAVLKSDDVYDDELSIDNFEFNEDSTMLTCSCPRCSSIISITESVLYNSNPGTSCPMCSLSFRIDA